MSDREGAEFPWKPPPLKDLLSSVPGLDGKTVALYFSAHWCPPCRRFTPQLVDVYNKLKAEHAAPESFEFVFVSSDRDASSFAEYFAEMPWKALPFDERKAK